MGDKAGELRHPWPLCPPTNTPNLSPEPQIKALQVQLAEALEKARLFEAMLDVLKYDYGVRVVKKPSGQSSHNTASRV